MTDKLPPLVTPIVPPSQTPFSLPTAVTLQDAARKQETGEEEPYTIKCICDFADDDGNTIYCEKCDTWQHIECYYPNNVEDALREDFSHSCAECQPRSLNRQLAIERQKARTTAPIVSTELTDKKAKRPPSKSHKKKPKPTELQLNGHPSVPEKHNSPHDHPHPPQPPKKSKNSHKSSQSISAQAPKRSPSYGNPKHNHGRPPSPATTPPDLPDDTDIHSYSNSFLALYDNPSVQTVHTNTFARLEVSNTITAWLRDPDRMNHETGVSYNDVFQKLPPDIESQRQSLEIEHTKKVVSPNTILRWQYLRTPSAVAKNAPLMELNGEIDFQATYSEKPENRWSELLSPLPFVFFHPMLPLYIDTRKEGSEARFVRRSCQPNATIEAFISDGREYHFWLVSDRQIPAKEQVTIPWDFRLPKRESPRMLSILGLGDEEANAQPELIIDEAEYQTIAQWIHLVLSEYGGCACNLGSDCAFARFRRNYPNKSHPRPNVSKEKTKKRKPKLLHAISPTSTGHATNSRAASEGHLEDVPEQNGRSVSSSSRSKPPSRDLTPTARQGSFDTIGILTEPTDRDKRKVAMVEASFHRMEQQHQPPKKRKRLSDGPPTKAKSTKSNSNAHTPTLPNGFSERHYVDAGTSRSKSGSPTSTASHRVVRSKKPISRNASVPLASRPVSVGPPSNYKDASVQTDPEEKAWYKELSPAVATPKRRIVSLSQRLLNSRYRLRADDTFHGKQRSMSGESFDVMDVDSTPDRKPLPLSPPLGKEVEKHSPAAVTTTNSPDIQMTDAPAVSPTVVKGIERLTTTSPTKNKSPELRVQMPPVPAFGSNPSTATTPLSAGGSTTQSPFSASSLPSPFGPSSVNGIAANPSPVKKKLSLSDYTKSRMNKASARPSVGTTTLKPLTGSEEPKSATSVDVATTFDSPTNEKSMDRTAPTTGVISTT